MSGEAWERLRAVADAATPGPWDAEAIGSEGYAVFGPRGLDERFPHRRPRTAHVTWGSWESDKADATFIAAANPATVIALLDAHADHEAQIRDLLEEREELLTEIRRLRMGNHPAGRALRATGCNCHADPIASHLALAEALTERDAEHEGGEGA